MALYKIGRPDLRAYNTNKMLPVTSTAKKKMVPVKKGAPNPFTKYTSKYEAAEIVPGITPT